MNRETYDKLIKWDSVLLNAFRLNFLHLNAVEFQELRLIYEENFNKKVTKSQMNCNSCRVKIVKELAKDYLEFKENDLKPKKKVGRPKKIDIE